MCQVSQVAQIDLLVILGGAFACKIKGHWYLAPVLGGRTDVADNEVLKRKRSGLTTLCLCRELSQSA